MVTVGIDFGTTNSTVAYMREGKIAVIEIDQSARSIPSCVAFVRQERLVGAPAIHQIAKNSENTIFDVKRLLGCNRNELQRQIAERLLPFRPTEVEGEAKIQVQYKGEAVTFYPEEIVATIFYLLKEITFKYVEKKISGAVITVPTSFNARQRTVIKYAAEIAEVPLLGLINETTAAAISYGVNMRTDSTRTILVFHLGGGSFDVALVEIWNDKYDVKAAGGSCRLGGEDFTTELFKKCLEIFSQKYIGINTKDITVRSRARLRLACEKAKKDLGIASHASIRVDSFCAGEDFEYIITEEEFEGINEHLVEEMRKIIDQVFSDVGFGKETVDDIVVVGAATRMNLAKKLFNKYGGSKIRKTINTNEAVALGAAVYASSLSGVWSNGKLDITDILSHAVYFERKNLFERGSKLPSQLQRGLDMSSNNSSLKLYYGDEVCSDPTAQEEVYEEYELEGMRKYVDILFAIDANGCLEVKAGDKVIPKPSVWKTDDVETLKNRAIEFRKEEKKAQQNLKSLHKLEKKVYELERNAKKIHGMPNNIKDNILNDCNSVIELIHGLLDPKDKDISDIQSKLRTIEQKILGKNDTESMTTTPADFIRSAHPAQIPGQVLDDNSQDVGLPTKATGGSLTTTQPYGSGGQLKYSTSSEPEQILEYNRQDIQKQRLRPPQKQDKPGSNIPQISKTAVWKPISTAPNPNDVGEEHKSLIDEPDDDQDDGVQCPPRWWPWRC